ncbi:hypothetical protein NZK32_14390 [Cyanobium sp. FGCU-52]|nr:hypothetical protein [Cyanobium sp. FGCU52]
MLSRKGFDARHGGIPSPILPDGTMLPLPIPHPGETNRLAQIPLPLGSRQIDELVRDLSGERMDGGLRVHADPQLQPLADALPGWRPCLGQAGVAAGHLRRQGVGPGDLFLFFGWFREVEQRHGRWAYRPGAPDRHLIFGWLEVGEVLPVGQDPGHGLALHPWLEAHPHLQRADLRADPHNTLYLAAPASRLASVAGQAAGRFRRATPRRRLTAPDAPGRSLWRLPGWWLPLTGSPSLSYHRDPGLWRRQGDAVLLKSARIGQEFVIELPATGPHRDWLAAVIAGGP